MDVEFVNPFVTATTNVFHTMLECEITRDGLSLKNHTQPTYDLSGVIGLSGRVSGSVIVSVSREVAFGVVERLLGLEVNEITSEVTDSLGELTNIISGSAKAELAQYELSLGLPNVIVGRNHSIVFPGNVTPLNISFQSAFGPLCLEVGFSKENTVRSAIESACAGAS
ncbi:MAG: chemotaxis protein CheX [Planctomycetaceae bacterium]